MRDLIQFLMTASPEPASMPGVDAWWPVHRGVVQRFTHTVDVAVAGGFAADRLGWAFASGYQAALGALLPGGAVSRPVAFCATEEDGAHPRDIHAEIHELDEGGRRLDGSKVFVTLGAYAELLVVIASEGQTPLGRNQLRAVLVDAGRRGVSLEDQAELPYIPEVPHGVVHFSGVALGAEDVLPGDGYDAYLKPFRTIEDLHVSAAALGSLVQILRRAGAPNEEVEALLPVLAAIRTLADGDPLAPEIHVALGGLEALRADALARAEVHIGGTDDETRRRWQRDRPLLSVAARVRQRRLEAARRALSTTGE